MAHIRLLMLLVLCFRILFEFPSYWNIIIIIIIILIITPMQGIYNYITETNRGSRVYNVTAVLYLDFVLQLMLLHP
jgi:hypothetical protein